MPARTAVAYAACALIWSTTWFVIRLCIGEGRYPTFFAAAVRFAIASGILLVVRALGWAGQGPRNGRQRAWVAVAGLLCALSYGLVYAAETRISGGLAAVIFGMLPLVTAVATLFTGNERPSWSDFAGALIGLAGIAIIYRDRMQASTQQALGVTMMFGAVCACTGYNVILKRRAGDLEPLATNVTFLVAAGVALGAFALVAERRLPPWPPPPGPTLALLYLAVFGSVAAFALYFYLLRRLKLMVLSTLVFIEPVVALLIDALLEREIRLGPRTYAGAAITLAGVAVSLGLRRRRPAA